MARHSLTTFAGRSIWCRNSSGPWVHDGGAPDLRSRPPVELPPFALSRLANLTCAVAARLRLSVPTWQHVHRRVLRELDIEFEPSSHRTRKFLHSLQLSWKLAATCTRHRPNEADITRERKFLQLRVIYLCDRFGISQDRIWNLDETAVRMVPIGERGWTKKPSQPVSSPRVLFVTLAANMRGCTWTQIVYEDKTDRVHPHGPLFPRQLVSHFSTHCITQDALLDMIDAVDTDMHARPGTSQHSCAKPHVGLCCVQRNFTGCTQPLDRAYMRDFKSSIRQEVAKHFTESNFERASLDSSTSVLRQLLLSFVHTSAQNADSPQHRAAGWRFISIGRRWSSVSFSQKRKRFLETGELFPRGTAEEPHEAEATDSEPEAHVMEPLADDRSDDEDAPLVSRSQQHQRHQGLPLLQSSKPSSALCLCVARRMSSASPARACMSASIALLSFVVASLPIHSTCAIVVSILHLFRQIHRLHSE